MKVKGKFAVDFDKEQPLTKLRIELGALPICKIKLKFQNSSLTVLLAR